MSLGDLKKRFKGMAMVHHPDKGGNMEEFIKIKRAYDEGVNILNRKRR